jgi:preprotein translocase subunit SecG
MAPILLAETTLLQYLFMFLLLGTSVFLILLVLVQRGRGGGLTGALGGMGGQSAFGTKAGDLFTRITIGTALVWILLCLVSIQVLNRQESLLGGDGPPAITAPTTGKGSVSAPGDTTAPGAGGAPAGGAAGTGPAEAPAGN